MCVVPRLAGRHRTARASRARGCPGRGRRPRRRSRGGVRGVGAKHARRPWCRGSVDAKPKRGAPGLVVVDADPAADTRAFEVVARAVEAITPRVVFERPGVCTFPTRGPSRYFGGDDALAALVSRTVRAAGVRGRTGRHRRRWVRGAARGTRAADADGAHVVEPDATPAFLAPWPVRALGASRRRA